MDLIQKAKNLGCIIKNDEYYLWEIQKWLREVHGIHIYVTTTSLGDYAVFITDSYDKHLISNKRIYNNAIHCSYTYEEALEVGLQEALKLIKEV